MNLYMYARFFLESIKKKGKGEMREPDGGVGVDWIEEVWGINRIGTRRIGEGGGRVARGEIRGELLDRSGGDRACLGRECY
jgi:hypothetical protein